MPTDKDMQAEIDMQAQSKSMPIKLRVEKLTQEQLMENAEIKHDKLEAKQKAENKRFTEHPQCRKVKQLLSSTLGETVMFLVIIADFALTIYETDMMASEQEQPPWLRGCVVGFIIFYVTELSLRCYADGIIFFSDSENVLDLIIVLIDILCAIFDLLSRGSMPGSTFLRIFRVARVFRVMRQFRELYLMMFSLLSTLKAIFWAVVLILLFLTCCSIIAVDVLHPINVKLAERGDYADSCARCPTAFKTVWEANITFIQQVLAGDSWGAVSLPIINEAPWALCFFLFVLLIVDLGLMNLVLTVIVDQADEAQRSNVEALLLDKIQEFKMAKRGLLQLCADLDTDLSGNLTLDELLGGYDSNPQFANFMAAMDTTREDVPTVFKMMDEDLSGNVSYGEFVDQMHKLKTQDTHTMIVLMHFEMQELRRRLGDFFQWDARRHNAKSFASGFFQSDDKTQIGEEVADNGGRSTASLAGDAQDDVAVHNVGQVAEATFSGSCLPVQSSAGESHNFHAEEGVLPSTSTRRLLASCSATPATGVPQPGVSKLIAARTDVQPELKHFQNSIANAIDIIVQDSLAISHERVLALTNDPDFLGFLQVSGTSSPGAAFFASI